MTSDSARLQIVIEARNASAGALEQIQRQFQQLGITIERTGTVSTAAGQQIARVTGSVSGLTTGTAEANRTLTALQGGLGDVGEVSVRTAQQVSTVNTQIALLRERLTAGGAAQVQIAGLSPQQLQTMTQAFRAANVEATQLSASVNRTGQVARTIQLQPGRTGPTAALDPLLQQLAQAEIGGVRFTDQLSRGLRGATEEMSKLAQGIGHGLGLFSSFGAGIGTAVVTAAITKAVADTTRAFAEFEVQLRGVNALLGQTGEVSERTFRGMEADVRSLASQFGLGTTAITKALYDVVSSGFKPGAEASNVLRASATLAVGNMADLGTTTEAVTSVLKAYSLPASDAGKVSDQLAQTVQLGKFRMDDFARTLGTVIPLAAQLGVTLPDVLGAMASASLSGAPAGQVAEGTRAALQNLLNPSAEARRIIGDLAANGRINADVLTAQGIATRGYAGTLVELNRGLGGNKDLLAAVLGDVTAVGVAAAITGTHMEQTATSIGKVGKASSTASTSLQEVDKAGSRAADHLAERWRILSEQFGEFASRGGLGAINILLAGADQMDKEGQAIRRLVDSFGEFGGSSGVKNFTESIALQQKLLDTHQISAEQAAANIKKLADAYAQATGALKANLDQHERHPGGLATAQETDGTAVPTQVQQQADASAAAIANLRDVLGQAFTPQETGIALQEASLGREADALRLTFEQQLDPLQRQLQTMEAMRDISADLNVLHLNLERTLLEEHNTQARLLDLQDAGLNATIQANAARRQQIILGLTVPILQRVATAAGANVDPSSPEFGRLNIAQQFIALRLSDAQAQLALARNATDPGRLQFQSQQRELEFRTRTAQLAADELTTRQQIDELPIEQHIKQIQLAENNRLTPLQRLSEELKLQSDYYNQQKAAIQWMIANLPAVQLTGPILSALPPEVVGKIARREPLSPDDIKSLTDAVQGAVNQSGLGGTVNASTLAATVANGAGAPAPPPAPAPTPAPAPASPVVPEVAAPLPEAPTPEQPPTDFFTPSGLPSGPATVGPSIGPPTIRGTGVPPAQRLVQPTVTVHVNNPVVDSEARSQAHAQATATAVLEALSSGFDSAPSSDSAGARYTP